MFASSPVGWSGPASLLFAGFGCHAVKLLVWGCCGLVVGWCQQSDQMPALSLCAAAVVTLNCGTLFLCCPLRGFCSLAGLISDQVPAPSKSAEAAVALVCVVLFPSPQGKCRFEGSPSEWGMLNVADSQENMRARCIVLARQVKSVPTGSHKCQAI